MKFAKKFFILPVKILKKIVVALALKPNFGKKLFQPFFEKLYHFSMLGMNVGGGGKWDEFGESNVI